jgi:hypothetical protein
MALNVPPGKAPAQREPAVKHVALLRCQIASASRPFTRHEVYVPAVKLEAMGSPEPSAGSGPCIREKTESGKRWAVLHSVRMFRLLLSIPSPGMVSRFEGNRYPLDRSEIPGYWTTLKPWRWSPGPGEARSGPRSSKPQG